MLRGTLRRTIINGIYQEVGRTQKSHRNHLRKMQGGNLTIAGKASTIAMMRRLYEASGRVRPARWMHARIGSNGAYDEENSISFNPTGRDEISQTNLTKIRFLKRERGKEKKGRNNAKMRKVHFAAYNFLGAFKLSLRGVLNYVPTYYNRLQEKDGHVASRAGAFAGKLRARYGPRPQSHERFQLLSAIWCNKRWSVTQLKMG